MRKKNETFSNFLLFKHEVESQTTKLIWFLLSDKKGKYLARCSIKWFIFNSFYTPYKSIQDFIKWLKLTWLLLFKQIYFNILVIHVQSLTNLPKSMWKLVFNVIDVIFKFGSFKKKTHKVHKNNAPFKIFKKYAFGTKNLKNIKNIL